MCFIKKIVETNNKSDKSISSSKKVVDTIEKSDESLKKYLQQSHICLYHLLMILSVIGFLAIITIIYFVNPINPNVPHPCEHDPMMCFPPRPFEFILIWILVFKIAFIVILSLVFVWWMKYLGKLVSDYRDSIKPWQKKITDAYGFLVEMDTMLYKTECEIEKERIKKSIFAN